MQAEPDDPVREAIERALREIASLDESLQGAHLGRWFVVTEHEWAEGGVTLSSFRSQGLPPWDSIGMLEFMLTMERDGALNHFSDDEE